MARRRGLTALPAAAFLLAACAAGRPPAPGPPMREGVYAAPLSLDPHLENEFLTSGILANVFEGLTSLDAAMRAEPALALSWDTPAPDVVEIRTQASTSLLLNRPAFVAVAPPSPTCACTWGGSRPG